MAHYLLSVHTGPGGEPPTPEQAQATFQRLGQLEDELKTTGARLFSGRLAEADTATVVRDAGDEMLTTDGPYLETKEHVAGFYIIAADDLDAALSWAGRVTAIIGEPIEVRPFAGLST
jgi:hypothetical protein